MDNTEKYTKVFDDWIAHGNRLLKIGDAIFLPTIDYKDGDVGTFAYVNDTHIYMGYVRKSVFGELISWKRTKIMRDTNMRRISLHRFASNLIAYDYRRNSVYKMNMISILFSFDQIDTGQLPERVLEELMIQKLSK